MNAAAAVVLLAVASHAFAEEHHVVVPPDKIQWGTAPPVLPAGAEIAVLEGNPAEKGTVVLRLKFPSNYAIPPHWHTMTERITVLSGDFRIGSGDTLDKNASETLTAGGYVFPVYGPSSFSDTFGAARGDLSSGWHHGDDIFAPLGAPVLAVASGTVFSVGWNVIGGNRLWLRDGQGNLFYYAQLSAFTPLAVNCSRVNAGAVLGFVGNTGDAQGTPFHLHFEVHPVGLLGEDRSKEFTQDRIDAMEVVYDLDRRRDYQTRLEA